MQKTLMVKIMVLNKTKVSVIGSGRVGEIAAFQIAANSWAAGE